MTNRDRHDPNPGAGTLFVNAQTRGPAPPLVWAELVKIREEPVSVPTPDVLLERGIGEYTFYQGTESILGKGKFSTVYKVVGPDGDHYALKHTPLHPHHPLIAARLLREPTLLAQLPSHPNLISVQGNIRTEGHFYLIEQFAAQHVPLPSHPLPLAPSRAAYILDQLVSVIRDCLHSSRVCHRDLKGENILVDQDTGDILILDLGLATRFSASAPKLTTCCGSPAFHSPEIVNALAHPPGAITYYGPELDIWCIALTLLTLLLRIRFPLGAHHTSFTVMRSRTRDRLQELDELYPPDRPYAVIPNYSHMTRAEKDHETHEWRRVRKAMKHFLDIDGKRRMQYFEAYQLGNQVQERVQDHRCAEGLGMKSTSFIPCDIKYTLPLYLEPNVGGSMQELVLDNPTNMTEKKILSYLRYLLRSAGIGYHCLKQSIDDPSEGPVYQLVVALPQQSSVPDQIPKRESSTDRQEGSGWANSLNPFKRQQPTRSLSVPAKAAVKTSPPVERLDKTDIKWLKTWIRIEFEEYITSPAPTSRSSSRTRVHTLSPLVISPHLPDVQVLQPPSRRPVSPRRRTTSDRFPSALMRPSPLSRQVSPEGDGAISRASSLSGRTRVTRGSRVHIHLSDERGYPVLRKALNIEHIDSTPNVEITHGSDVAIIKGHPPLAEDEERGRPRSKESPPASSILVESVENKVMKGIGIQVVEHKDKDKKERRGGSGNRKNGFWSLFASIESSSPTSHRSNSMPPSRKALK